MITLGSGPLLADPEPRLELDLPSSWVKSFEARVWAGYKENVLLADRNTVDSPFLAGGFDASIFRLPIDGWEYQFFTSLEYLRYLNSPQVPQEASAIVQGQAQKSFGQGWKAGLAVEYLYFNQVFDNSIYQDIFQAIPVQGHTITLRPALSRELSKGWRLELELPATRQQFDQIIDDYWEAGPKLTLRHEFGKKSELTFYYQFADRWHDTRQARDAEGQILPGHALQFYLQEWGMGWRQVWDAGRHWRTTTRLSLQRNEDNGGGYYDYFRPQLSQQLRYQGRDWEVRADAKLSYYHYDRQHIATLDSELREKAYLRLSLRGEKALSKAWKVFAQFEHEQALANLELDRYEANTFSVGLGWEF